MLLGVTGSLILEVLSTLVLEGPAWVISGKGIGRRLAAPNTFTCAAPPRQACSLAMLVSDS